MVNTELLLCNIFGSSIFLLPRHTIQQQAVAKNLKSSLPSIEELEAELSRGEGGDE